MLCLKIAGWVANSVDPNKMLVASHLDLHCLLRPVFPNTYSKYGTYIKDIILPLSGQIQQMSNWQYFSYFVQENRRWHSMQIVNYGKCPKISNKIK